MSGSTAQRVVHVLRAGPLSYLHALRLQQNLSARRETDREDHFQNVIVLTEHSPVYTIGIRTKGYSEDETNRLRELGAEFHRTNRGGLITFHGPGQMVAYPILYLKHFKPSLRWYVCAIERTIVDLCSRYGLHAETSADTGVWVEDKKICAIGLHASRYVTTHGLALNCQTDLRWFEHIVPCGIEGKGVTSLSRELQRPVDTTDVQAEFLRCFAKVFECNMQEMNADTTKQLLDAASEPGLNVEKRLW